MTIASLAIKNLGRKRSRTVVLMLIVAVAAAAIFSEAVFVAGLSNSLTVGTRRLGADVLVVPERYEGQARSALLAGEPSSFFMSTTVLDEVRRAEGVKTASPQLFIKPTPFKCCYRMDVFLIAFDPATDFTITPWLARQPQKRLGTHMVLTGKDVPASIGDTIPFYGTSFRVVGAMDGTGMNFLDRAVFLTMEDAYAMADASKTESLQPLDLQRGMISAILVQMKEGFAPERAAIKLESDIPGIKTIVADEVTGSVRRQVAPMVKGMIAVSGILWILAFLVMGFAFSMIVNERQRELGLLRAMGAKRRHVFRLIITEASIISVGGGIAGLTVGSVLLFTFEGLIRHGLNLPYLMPSISGLIALVTAALMLSLLTGLLSSLLPAVSAGKMEPYDAIRKGE